MLVSAVPTKTLRLGGGAALEAQNPRASLPFTPVTFSTLTGHAQVAAQDTISAQTPTRTGSTGLPTGPKLDKPGAAVQNWFKMCPLFSLGNIKHIENLFLTAVLGSSWWPETALKTLMRYLPRPPPKPDRTPFCVSPLRMLHPIHAGSSRQDSEGMLVQLLQQSRSIRL